MSGLKLPKLQILEFQTSYKNCCLKIQGIDIMSMLLNILTLMCVQVSTASFFVLVFAV